MMISRLAKIQVRREGKKVEAFGQENESLKNQLSEAASNISSADRSQGAPYCFSFDMNCVLDPTISAIIVFLVLSKALLKWDIFVVFY